MKKAGSEKQDRGNRLNLKERLPPDWDKEEKMWKSGELFTYFADWKVDRIDEVIFEDNSGGVPHYHCMDTIICRKVT